MTANELSKMYNASTRTIKRWRRLNAPLDDEAAMQAWIERHRSRTGVGKYSPRTPEPALAVEEARDVVAEVVPASESQLEPAQASDEPETDDTGTLRRLEEAERIAYRRYRNSGGNERAAQIWLLCTDQLRRFKDSAQKHKDDVSAAETKFMATCCEVIDTLHLHLKTAPKLLGMLCEGLDRDAIAAKIADQLERTVRHAVSDLSDQLRGTSLERLVG
jgi:hypothetical protein